MLKHIYNWVGDICLRTEEAQPKCGCVHPDQGDYCDACGDCLVCYAEDKCHHSNTGEHVWIEYKEFDSTCLIQ